VKEHTSLCAGIGQHFSCKGTDVELLIFVGGFVLGAVAMIGGSWLVSWLAKTWGGR
jgi:hypothetical protein